MSFVTGEASEKCHKEKRKTVNGDDICWALGSLGFDDYAKSMRRYLNRYSEIEQKREHQNKNNDGRDEFERMLMINGIIHRKLWSSSMAPNRRISTTSSINSFFQFIHVVDLKSLLMDIKGPAYAYGRRNIPKFEASIVTTVNLLFEFLNHSKLLVIMSHF
ncbi:nuclear transcription factor Y subunit B-7-like [Camellia sinensis]|uniref:nuclear transcription factor Y subunit B-7-like n=1 Tax=Camellia sinensis TaxID=4442 RepID=UPI0010359DF2|nr:nuclear transcription factor Y subunit B-7-like [Camellia sinensis]